MASAEFTANGGSTAGGVAVAASSTVTLALVSTVGVRTVAWSIEGNHSPGATNPTITPAGSPSGATASFEMPSGSGQAYIVQCKVNGGVDELNRVVGTQTFRAVVGVNSGGGILPFAAGEETERSETHGWVPALNAALSLGGGPGGTPSLSDVLDEDNDAGGNTIENLGAPVNDTDADTKGARDAAISALTIGTILNQDPGTSDYADGGTIYGLVPDEGTDSSVDTVGGRNAAIAAAIRAYKPPVKVIATSNLTLSGVPQTIDGVSIGSGDRVFASAQSTATQIGVYIAQSGAWVRAGDYLAGSNAAGSIVSVEQGTTYAESVWLCTSNTGSAVVGANSLAFRRIDVPVAGIGASELSTAGAVIGDSFVFNGTAWVKRGIKGAALTDASATINWSSGSRFVWDGTATSNRTTTIGTSGSPPSGTATLYTEIYNGATYTRTVVNGGTNGSSLGDTYTVAANEHVSLGWKWNGTDWKLSSVLQLN